MPPSKKSAVVTAASGGCAISVYSSPRGEHDGDGGGPSARAAPAIDTARTSHRPVRPTRLLDSPIAHELGGTRSRTSLADQAHSVDTRPTVSGGDGGHGSTCVFCG